MGGEKKKRTFMRTLGDEVDLVLFVTKKKPQSIDEFNPGFVATTLNQEKSHFDNTYLLPIGEYFFLLLIKHCGQHSSQYPSTQPYNLLSWALTKQVVVAHRSYARKE